MHDLASNTELDSENHKMKVVLKPKFFMGCKESKQTKQTCVTGCYRLT